MKNQIEKDIEATIRLLRFMTWHEGSVYLSMFDSGHFEEGTVTAYLERSGLTIEDKKFYTPQEFKDFILQATNPFHFTEEELSKYYKKSKWNDE